MSESQGENKSERGRILVASRDGTHLLRFVGDVRLTLCVAIDDYLKEVFTDPDFEAVVIDLSQADGLDSTSLGILAKLAKEARVRNHKAPLLVPGSEDVQRCLESVGIDSLFETASSQFSDVAPIGALEAVPVSESATRGRVLEAHRALMALNSTNAKAFRDLVTQLEALGVQPS